MKALTKQISNGKILTVCGAAIAPRIIIINGGTL